MADAIIKVGDTARLWTDTLKLGGVVIDLTGATVKLRKRPLNQPGATVVRDATIVSAAGGTVSYQPVDADVNTAGSFWIEWQIIFGDGTDLTVPSSTPPIIQMDPHL